jgi:hypothetical protein
MLVVTTTGVDERTWVDHFGYPHTVDMILEERYRRTAYDVLELSMTITDPKIYTRPWVSQTKKFRKLETKMGIKTVDGWGGLMEDICAPADEVDNFNKRVRDPLVASSISKDTACRTGRHLLQSAIMAAERGRPCAQAMF